jgi:DnaJ-class molecular chaperone
MKNYYEILGVQQTVTAAQLKKAYRKLALEHHPDRNQGNKEAEEKFKELSAAYQVLSNPEKRREYVDGRNPEALRWHIRRGVR